MSIETFNPTSLSHPFWTSLVTRNSLSFLALTWLIWDCIRLFPQEQKFIWRNEQLTIVKRLYLILRYLGLGGQSLNCIFTAVLLSRAPLHPNICRAWFGYQVIIIQSLHSALQIILMIRIYALYNRHLHVGFFLSFVWITELVVMTYAGVRTIRFEFSYDSTCLIRQTPRIILLIGGVVIGVQIILGIMTALKHYTIGSRNNPIMRLVTRDGVIVCSVFLVFYIIAIPYSMLVHVLTHSMFSITISLLSTLGCHLVLNIQRLEVKDPQRSRETQTDTWCLETAFDDTLCFSDISHQDYAHPS